MAPETQEQQIANALGQLPVRIGSSGKAVLLGAYADIHRSLGPIAVERNHLQRAAHVLMQTEGRDIGSVAADLDVALRKDPRTRDVKFEANGRFARVYFFWVDPGVKYTVIYDLEGQEVIDLLAVDEMEGIARRDAGAN